MGCNLTDIDFMVQMGEKRIVLENARNNVHINFPISALSRR